MSTSLLATDGYKFSMAEAGWPLREETFYYCHRKGGAQVLPFDVEQELSHALPRPTPADYSFLSAEEYEMGAGFKAAITRAAKLVVRALPKGAVFFDREPVFCVSGPSALVSWLEPLVLMWSYRIQVATLALSEPEKLAEAVATVTCERQRQLVLETLDAVGVRAPPIRVDADGYAERVRARVSELVEIVGDASRIFEVGLRAASCVEQHLLALEAAKSAGLKRTSHVLGAQRLSLTPVGTMGHEHVQRYGSDEAAFRAMSERRPHRSSYLLDTFDTMKSGIPAALALIAERRGEGDSIRYDSGDKEAQYRFACARSDELGVKPVQILEDGFDAAQTRRFEQLRAELGVEPSRQVYGYGGYLIASTAGGLTRDRVAAVYKLSQTGRRATMKFANDAGAGKQSIPGRPMALRRRGEGAVSLIVQQGEAAPAGWEPVTSVPLSDAKAAGAELSKWRSRSGQELSSETQQLIAQCHQSAFSRLGAGEGGRGEARPDEGRS